MLSRTKPFVEVSSRPRVVMVPCMRLCVVPSEVVADGGPKKYRIKKPFEGGLSYV